jgi:hypothetical protein
MINQEVRDQITSIQSGEKFIKMKDANASLIKDRQDLILKFTEVEAV